MVQNQLKDAGMEKKKQSNLACLNAWTLELGGISAEYRYAFNKVLEQESNVSIDNRCCKARESADSWTSMLVSP